MDWATFWRQFKVLTWKNTLLKRRNKRTFCLEILIPVLLTVGMLGIYGTIKPVEVMRNVPGFAYAGTFEGWANQFGEPKCNYWTDTTVLWRCPQGRECTGPDSCSVLTFAVAPKSASDASATAAATAFFAKVVTASNNTFPVKSFASAEALESHITQKGYASGDPSIASIGVAVVFDTTANGEWKYEIRTNRTTNGGFNYLLPPTFVSVDPLLRNSFGGTSTPRTWSSYLSMWYQSGALAVQSLVDEFIVSQTAGRDVTLEPGFVDFPAPGYKETGFWGIVSNFYGIFMVISILYPVSNTIRGLVMEKEQKIREGMRMMSLMDSAHFLSWGLNVGTTFTIIAVLIVLVAGPLFQYSDRGLILLYYLLYFYSTTSFCFFMSTFFSKAKTAAILGVLPYFGGYFITLALKRDTARWAKFLAALHPSAAFTLAMTSFTDYEDAGVGVTKFTWTTSASTNFAFSDALIMMFVDIFVYSVLYWYNDKVWPSEFGTRLPPWFCLLPSYWKSMCPGLLGAKSALQGQSDDDVEAALKAEQGKDIEPVSETLAQQIRDGKCVIIRHLCKSFNTNTGIKHAVDDLNLTMYSGQITALLGHNGAGKSTTMGMLTGLISPSSGMAMIDNKDISVDMPEIRKSLGVCPQHDVLFGELTVEEHLTLFGRFKGVPNDKLKEAVEEMIREVGLTEKRKVAAANLSGGMKRKLSVGIAFIGDSKVVFLDEPTSGMDPYSRRFTWNVIRKYREGRVIVLTTHFMDEADLLGDRIAIMAKGNLRACGSSLFLKNHFGVGYSFVVEKTPNAVSDPIIRFVLGQVADAKVLTNVGAEVSFQLPLSAAASFRPMLEALDSRAEQLGVETYGMSVTTLEEVFCKIVKGEETDKAAFLEKRNSLELERRASLERRNTLDNSKNAGLEKEGTTGGGTISDKPTSPSMAVNYSDHWRFFRFHMRALLIKRLLYFKRDKKAWGYQFVMPGIFVLIGCILLKSGINSIFAEKQPSLVLNTAKYNPKITTHPLPLPYSAPGPFWYSTMYSNSDFRWQQNFNVTGQSDIIANIANYQSLPAHEISEPFGLLNLSRALLTSRNSWKATRYGAFSFNNVSRDGHRYSYNVHANFTGVHAGPIYANMLSGAIARLYNPAASISTVVNPLPVTEQELLTASSFDGFPVVVMIMLAFAFIPAAFVLFVVRERETKAKHLQIVSGVSFLSYWLSTWIFDFLSYQIPLWLTVIIIKAFDAQALIKGEAMGVTIVLLELFGASICGFSYLLSFLFKTPSQAQASTILANFVTGLILVIVTIIMSFIPTTRDAARKVVYFLRLFPPFALGNGLVNVVFVDFFGQLDSKEYSVWDMQISGYGIAYMAVETVVYMALTLLVEYLSRRRTIANFIAHPNSLPPISNADKDADVLKEEQRVSNPTSLDDVVILKDMKKVYPGGKVAVRGLSLGIPNGECFGLLGINGAGKTTTLSILTAEFPPSAGEVRLGGYDISDNPDVVRRLVGYCPQFDALFDLLTGREHLELYARVKGLDEKQVKSTVDRKISEMDLVEYSGRNASTYSGGNKRKLSVAMAMIGKPLIVFLDEPSTGMDPVARRFMWQVISDITTKRGECCIILTTHSMEECEALCTRIGIMVGGRLHCLGSAQRLKSRFGMGFQLEASVQLPSAKEIENLAPILPVKNRDGKITEADLPGVLESLGRPDWAERINGQGSGADVWQSLTGSGSIGVREFASWAKMEGKMDILVGFIEAKFPGALLRERQGAKVRYEMPFKDTTGKVWKLSEMFGIIEDNKTRLCIEDYSVSQTSLEQIFNSFASQQEEEQGPAVGIVKDSHASPSTGGGGQMLAVAPSSTMGSPASLEDGIARPALS